MSTGLTINRQNGNVPKSVAGKDHVSGLIAYLLSTEVPEAFKTAPVQGVSTIDKAEQLGITADAKAAWSIRVLHYQLSEILRVNKGITLYLGIFAKPDTHTFAEIKTMQHYALGEIRQIGIWDGTTALTPQNIVAIQNVADSLDEENAPPSVVYAPKVADYKKLPANLAAGQSRVSVCIAQDGGGTGAALFAHTDNSTRASVSAVGVMVATMSLAAVHQCIAWVKKFPSGISQPALSDGVLVRDIDKAELAKLDTGRYCFLITHVGIAGSYWNDSHNMDLPTSDYAAIENVCTMDKAVRGIRVYVTPELGGNVYIDPVTGKMQPYTVEHLQSTANIALEEMEKAGELSGYSAEIDPEQNVGSTSEVEIVIKNVAVAVARKIRVKIGYVKTV